MILFTKALKASWAVKGVERVNGHHSQFEIFPKPLTKKLSRNCLAKFEAGQKTTEAMLAHKWAYTYDYREPLAVHSEFWEYDSKPSLWRYGIGDIIYLLS